MPGPGCWADMRDDLAHAAVLVDFDGTLSDVVTDPDRAEALAGVADILDSLTDHAHTVAVISGRPVSFLAARLGPKVTLSGLYGMEARSRGEFEQLDGVRSWKPIVADTVIAAREELPNDVLVEDKTLTLTLHYRQAPNRRPLVERWAADRAVRTGLVVAASRCSVELNPPVDADKGTVVRNLATATGVRAACYIGDDRADVAAFDALDVLGDAGLVVCKVAVGGVETPAALLAAADLVVDGPTQVRDLLRSLLEAR